MEFSDTGSRSANPMCPITDNQMKNANQSWTNVAPVRQSSEKYWNQNMIEPVASITTIAAATNDAFNFWPGLNLPSCARARVRRDHQRRSSGIQRLRRCTSARNCLPDRSNSAHSTGTGSASPL
jgi:hypothetical protein